MRSYSIYHNILDTNLTALTLLVFLVLTLDYVSSIDRCSLLRLSSILTFAKNIGSSEGCSH